MRAPPRASSAAPRSRAASAGPRSRAQQTRGARGTPDPTAPSRQRRRSSSSAGISGLGHEPAAELAEPAAGVGHGAHVASFALRMKRRMRSWSLMPGELSTPRAVSTAHGRAVRTASATLSGIEAAGQDHRRADAGGPQPVRAQRLVVGSRVARQVEQHRHLDRAGHLGCSRMPTIVRLFGWAKRPYTWTRSNLSHEWRWTAVSA